MFTWKWPEMWRTQVRCCLGDRRPCASSTSSGRSTASVTWNLQLEEKYNLLSNFIRPIILRFQEFKPSFRTWRDFLPGCWLTKGATTLALGVCCCCCCWMALFLTFDSLIISNVPFRLESLRLSRSLLLFRLFQRWILPLLWLSRSGRRNWTNK